MFDVFCLIIAPGIAATVLLLAISERIEERKNGK